MGFNLGAALGGATEGFKSTWKDINEENRKKEEEARRKREDDYIQGKRKQETDFQAEVAAIPTVGAQFSPDNLPEDRRPTDPAGATYQYTTPPGVSMPPPVDGSLEGAPAQALPVQRTRKFTQSDQYAMLAAAARRSGQADKALEYSRLGNQEDLRGVRALLFKGAATEGWEGLDKVMRQVNDGKGLSRKQNKDGTWSVSYGDGQELVVGTPMQAAMLASAAMEGDPDHFSQYYNTFADQKLKTDAQAAQTSHYAEMARLQGLEIEANERYRNGMLALQRAQNDTDRAKIEAQLKPEKDFADISRKIQVLMADPYGNSRDLQILTTQLATMAPDKVMRAIKNEDGTETMVNSLDQMVRAATQEREAALQGQPLFASGAIYLDPIKGGYRVRGLESKGVRYTEFNGALAAAQDLARKSAPAAAAPAAPAGSAGAMVRSSSPPPERGLPAMSVEQLRAALAKDDEIKKSFGGSVGRAIQSRTMPLSIAERMAYERQLLQLTSGK